MAGGQSITSGQGSVTQSEDIALSGGVVTLSQGALGAIQLSGAASSVNQGDAVGSRLIQLKSRKVGGGSSTRSLSGVSISHAVGSLAVSPQIQAAGIVISGGVGAFAKSRTVSASGGSAVFSHGNMSPPGASGPLASNFQITSSVGGTNLPFALGYAFRQGDVPSGQIATTADASSWQCTPKNYWPDGSLKFALLAGRKTLTAGIAATITLSAASPSGGTALAISDLKATGVTASIGFGASAVSWATTDWDSPAQTLTSGPVMSSWTYRKPIGSDAHLVGWLEVRLFAGGHVQVLPWVENGYLGVTGPTQKDGRATFTLGGSLRYDSIDDANTPGGYSLNPTVSAGGVLSMPHHTRAVLVRNGTHSYWLGTDPQITPAHNRPYLKSTKFAPEYHPTAIDESSLSALATHYNPGRIAYITPGMGGTGYAPDIGLLPNESALWLVSGDVRAYRAVIASGFSLANYCIHYRDEATNRPLLFASHPTKSQATGTDLPTVSGNNSCVYAASHHPAASYLPYLLTGWNWFLEELQFQVTDHWLIISASNRDDGNYLFHWSAFGQAHNDQGGFRSTGWQWRSCAMAAALTPDADTTLKAQFVNAVAYSSDWYKTYITTSPNANVLGLPEMPDSSEWWKIWQHAFWTASLGLSTDLQVLSNSTDISNQAYIFDHFCKAYAGVLGRAGVTSEYRFTNAANYAGLIVGTQPPPVWYTTWGQVWTTTWGSANTDASANTLVGGNIESGSTGFSTSYWGNIQPAIAAAVDRGAPGVWDGYKRMIGATNWATKVAQCNSIPVWGIRPRLDTQFANAAASLAVNSWVQITGHGMTNGMIADAPNWVTAYLDKGAYDPVRRQVRFIGQAHLGDMRYYQYDEATNVFSVLPDTSWDDGDSGPPSQYEFNHGYQGNTTDPATGDHYYRPAFVAHARALNRTTGSWSITSDASGFDTINGSAGGLEWLPNYGAQGGLVLYCRSQLRLWNKATNTWGSNISPITGFFGIHNIALRNWASDWVYVGGGNGSSQLARVNPGGTASLLTAGPVDFGPDQCVTTTCPVSGKLLVLKGSSGNYSYNPTTNTWSSGISIGSPPSILTTDISGGAHGIVAVPLPGYGVIAFFLTRQQQVWLYRHT